MKREKTLYSETYRKGTMKFSADRLPICLHTLIAPEIKPDEAYLTKAGVIERDGVEYEFNEIRMYFKKGV